MDDSLTLARRAAEAHVRVRMDVHPHMFHGFHSRANVLREAADTIATIGAFLRDSFARGRSWETQA